MTAPTSRESDKFMLRLPDGMREQLKELARQNNRSLNAEIVSRLEDTLAYESRPRTTVTKDVMAEVARLMERISALIEPPPKKNQK